MSRTPASTEAGNPLSASLNLAPNLNENSEISEMAQSAQSVTNTVVTPQSDVMTYTYDANNRMLTQKNVMNTYDSNNRLLT